MKTRGRDLLNKFHGGDEDQVDNIEYSPKLTPKESKSADRAVKINEGKLESQSHGAQSMSKIGFRGNAIVDFIVGEKPSPVDAP